MKTLDISAKYEAILRKLVDSYCENLLPDMNGALLINTTSNKDDKGNTIEITSWTDRVSTLISLLKKAGVDYDMPPMTYSMTQNSVPKNSDNKVGLAYVTMKTSWLYTLLNEFSQTPADAKAPAGTTTAESISEPKAHKASSKISTR